MTTACSARDSDCALHFSVSDPAQSGCTATEVSGDVEELTVGEAVELRELELELELRSALMLGGGVQRSEVGSSQLRVDGRKMQLAARLQQRFRAEGGVIMKGRESVGDTVGARMKDVLFVFHNFR